MQTTRAVQILSGINALVFASTAFAKFYSASLPGTSMDGENLFTGLSHRQTFVVLAVVEAVLVALMLSNRPPMLKGLAGLWFSTCALAHHGFTRIMKIEAPCGCLGQLPWLPRGSETPMVWSALFVLFACSAGLLILALNSRAPAESSVSPAAAS